MRFYRDEKRVGVSNSVTPSLREVLGPRHLKAAVLWAGFLAVLFTVYGLYGLPWGPALYAALLCSCLAAAALARSLLRERGRLARLRMLLKGVETLGKLPDPSSVTERAYQELIAGLDARCRRAEETARQQAEEAARYYTLWSHQVKTPIAAMRLLLQETPMDRAALEQELFKTEQYAEMALQYQRLGGGSDLVLRECALEPMVRQAVKRTALLFIRRKIALSLEPLEVTVLTDEKWLVFALEQLLTNAVKYTPEGGAVTISLTLPCDLSVTDTGIGIRPEDLPRVMERGYTGHNGRLDKRSTGIGLWLCKQALDMLGHGIGITSEVGKGTSVTLRLSRERLETE